MAGGSGTRFWPLSRSTRPKQFLQLTGSDRSLIQATADRVQPLVGNNVLVVTAENQAPLVREQLPDAAVLSEPVPRNTAACVGYAAKRVLESCGDVPMICLPADHLIFEEAALRTLFEQAVALAAAQEVLITIGLTPDRPETGYGYIERGDARSGGGFNVRRFVEKPNRDTAQKYVDSGHYFWNSGMFVWRPSTVLAEIKKHLPQLSQSLDQIAAATTRDETARLYGELQSVSVDVGVMEKASNVLMLPGDGLRWSDVGSWDSWVEVAASEQLKGRGNFIEGDVVLVDSKGCAVLGNKNINGRKLIAGVGLNDMVIVETDDAILICDRNHAQDVKKIVDVLKERKRTDLL